MKIYRILPGAKGVIIVHRLENGLCSSPVTYYPYTVIESTLLCEPVWKCAGTEDNGKYYDFRRSDATYHRQILIQSEYVQVSNA